MKIEPNGNGDDELGLEGVGVERVSIREIDLLIDVYVEARDKRMALTIKEVDAKQNLISALHAHADEISQNKDGALVYLYGDLQVTLKTGKDDLKVRTTKEPDDEN